MKNKLPKRLKQLRQDADISQSKLGIILGVSQQTYNGWENGTWQPDADMLIRLASYFNVTVDYIIGYSNDMYAGDKRKLNTDEMAMAMDSSIHVRGNNNNVKGNINIKK